MLCCPASEFSYSRPSRCLPKTGGMTGARSGPTWRATPVSSLLRMRGDRLQSRSGIPLMMFSSGFSMPAWSYLYAGTRLASHGFIVAAVQHFSESVWPWDGYDGLAFIAYNRPRDVTFALSQLLRRSGTPGDLLHGAIDDRHLISSGHSYGGYAALVEAGGDNQVCDSREILDSGEELPPEACQPSPPDPRFSALITLDASAYVLRFEEMTRIKVPGLIMGEENFERFGEPYLTFVARPHAAISEDRPAVR